MQYEEYAELTKRAGMPVASREGYACNIEPGYMACDLDKEVFCSMPMAAQYAMTKLSNELDINCRLFGAIRGRLRNIARRMSHDALAQCLVDAIMAGGAAEQPEGRRRQDEEH